MAGLDTETSSLEYKADQIAGVCVSGGVDYSPQGYAGYYIPLRHIGYGANLPVDVVMEFVQWLIDNFQTVLFNRNFDTSMLEYDGVKIPFVGGMHDAQIMAYSVFNEAYPSLKDYSRRFLKWDMIDFAENKAKDHNFKTTDPTVSYIYAAGDPIATVFLARKLWSTYPYIRKIYKIDNYCLEAVRRLCQNELTLDYDFLEALRDETERHLAEIRTKIYSMSGVYGFNIDSSREKADVLSRFVTLTEKTKSGKFKTDEEALRRLNHPIANLMIDYAQTRVLLKSFVAKMCTYKGRTVRANYNTVNVPSGRLSSGASEGNPYFVPQNLQNCLVGDTRVQTKDGMKLLRDVKVGDYVWDGDEFRRITQKVNQGVRKVYKMSLADGKTLVGTADHPILSENGFVELAKCNGLRVALNSKKIYPRSRYGFIRFRVGRGPYPSTKEVRYLNFSSPDLWGLIGMLVGDGSSSERKLHICFDWHAISLCHRVSAVCRTLNIPHSIRTAKEKEGVHDIPLITIYNADLWRLAVKMGLTKTAREKSVPDVLYKLSPLCKMAFLKGLYAADGSFQRYKTSPSIRTVSEKLANGVVTLAETLGINAKATKYKNSQLGCGYAYTVSFFNPINCQDVFTYEGQVKWAPEFHKKGLEKYVLPKSLGGYKQRYVVRHDPDYLRSKFWVKCLSVEEAGEEEVFDITVETSERFMANGIIVHNCPKEEEKLYLHHHPKIGYVLLREEEGCVRNAKGEPVKYKTKTGLHRAFIPHDKDWVIMSSDYCLNPESTVVTEKGVMTLRDMLEQPKGLKVLTPWGYKETYDLRYTGKHKQYKFELTTGETLICSPEHKLAVCRDRIFVWVEAKNIRITDCVLTTNRAMHICEKAPSSNIKEIAVSDEPIEMMDMGVRDVHCFYCNDILVHNCAQELRLAANFSHDPNFLEPLLKGDDIHMHVAKQMFGYEDPLHRTKVKIVNFCLGEDSYVMTDSGIVRPASLKGDERLLKVFGGTQTYRMEVRLSDTVKVHYSNGVVEEYDSRHQVAVTSDKGLTWKRVCDLTEDDEVLISVGRMKETSSPLIERIGTYRKFSVSREKEYNLSTKEFAYLAGLYLGDGHISLGKQGRPNSVSWVAEEQIYPLVEECLTKLGLKWSFQNYEGKNYRLYRVHSSQFVRVLCKHFGRTKTKTISDGVLSAWGKDLFIPLCQGLVDSDGTLHGNVLVYFTCLDELAKKVALVLSGLGIYVRERVADHNCHHLRMSENDVVQSNLDRKRWGSGRPLLDFRKYDRSILEGLSGGFENGRVDNMRRGKCGLWVKSSLVEKAGYSGLRPVSVVSVSKPKTGKIYVIETETGSYLSSSVVSHNSALYGAEYPTVSARLGIPLQEGKTLMTRYKQTMSKLYAWKAEIVKAAKRRGYALTYFGRPVYLLKYFNSPDRGMSAYAERLAVNATIQGPVTPDTPVLLEDGYHLMKDVPDQGICATGKGFARYVKVFSGVQPIVELEFEDGSILKCSKEHRLLSVQPSGLQWMEASEIVEGTPIASHLSPVVGSPVRFDLSDKGVRGVTVSPEINSRVEETFYWIGRAFGDGSFLENGVIHWVFGIHECEDRDRLVKWGNALGLHVNLQEFSKEKDKSRRGDCLRATISSKNLCRLLKQIGVQFGVTAHDKRIPSRVFTASFEQRRQFVKGLFDSDGSKNWGWHMCNGDLLHDLQTLLLSMGVFSRWHKCKDAYILNITSLKEFASLVGRERLISKCQQSRMIVPDYMASRFVEKYRSGELRYFRKGILPTDRTIICKLRKRGPVGYLKFVELCDQFGWDVWKEDDFYPYKKVKSIRSLGESEVYCLSVEDSSHQFITNGVVSHNCIPADTFAPSQDGKVISTLRNLVGKRVQFAKDERGTAHKGVPVFRGKLPCAMVEFLSGDFIMVSTNHKFLKYKSNTLLSIEEAAADAVQFVKPHKKVKLFKAILNTLLGRFKGTTLNSLAVFPRHDKPADSVEIATALFRAFIRDEHLITYNPVLAHSVRSLVDLYGYNLVKVCSGRYALSWSRAKKSKVCLVDNLKGTYDVMSPTMISGFQTYPLSGMIHKNTGADLMRLFLIKFTKLNIDDKDWRENTRMILPVHDEMNLEVSIPYMREAWLKMRKVMNFFPDNFAVPIVVDTGVGTSWGNCLDVECISPKGRVVPKDIDPDDFSGEERAYLQEILEECVFEELPDRLKKFVKC